MKAFKIGDLRSIVRLLNEEKITMPAALDIINQKAEIISQKAFRKACRLRMNCKGSELEEKYKEFQSS